MAFDYRFDRVMKLAANQKQYLEIQYKQLFDEFERLASQLITLIEQKKQVQTDLQSQMSQATTVDQMQMGFFDVNHLEKRIDLTRDQYVKAKFNLEHFQLKLQEKALEVKKYEKMKQKQRSIYRKLMNKAEMKQMDEIAARQSAHFEMGVR